MRVRSSKIEVRCGSACGSIIEVRVCVRHTVKFLATQRLENSESNVQIQPKRQKRNPVDKLVSGREIETQAAVDSINNYRL